MWFFLYDVSPVVVRIGHPSFVGANCVINAVRMAHRADPRHCVDAFIDGQVRIADTVVEADQRVDWQQ